MADLFLSKEAIEKLLKEKAIFRLLMEEDEPLAFCEYQIQDKRLFLSKLYVHKNHRHSGLGKMLFLDSVRYAKENKINKIFLTVNKDNTPSFEIYRHLGFKVIDAVVNDIGQGYVMDDYIMEYQLKDE